MLRNLVFCLGVIRITSMETAFEIGEAKLAGIQETSGTNMVALTAPNPRKEIVSPIKTNVISGRKQIQQKKPNRVMKPPRESRRLMPKCSKVLESCLPFSLCCDPCATCHCRFFNAICYCRKLNRNCRKKI
ncbi:agouti-related protein-like [Polypterus senegalus]|uniref:agouti-related protein-like n=1 Tax=Polypterus senegalus TaxID=55291 RepID=UPI001965EA94|nr:agouti-related protein-like [Polypterus senegalus]